MTTPIVLLAAALAGPPLVVLLTAMGVPWPAGAALVAGACAVFAYRRRATALPAGVPRPLLLASALMAVVSAGLMAQLATFMIDPHRADASVFPSRAFFRTHSCLSSYTEAARLARDGANIFDPAPYAGPPDDYQPRFIGPLEVDLYQYPPPFLLLPEAARVADLEFFTVRRVWFALQAVVLFAGTAVLARWVGGVPGAVALLLVPVVWLAPTTRLTLQIGNFQATAFPLAMLAMIGLTSGRAPVGGLALGFATVSKIFPGVLGLLLLAERRWRAVVWTAVAAVVLTVAAVLAVGQGPFVDFVRYQLPRIESGEAFFWIEDPAVAPVNQSVYGLVTKLRLLGVPGTGRDAAALVSSLYALALVPLVALAARGLSRLRALQPDGPIVRLRTAQVWLGLLSLASFRSPFVPDAYGFVATLWLLTLVAAEAPRRPASWVAFGVGAAVMSIVLDGGPVPSPVPAWLAAATLALQVGALALNATVVAWPHRALPAPAAPALPIDSRAA